MTKKVLMVCLGFRGGLTCKTALQKVVNDFKKFIDKGNAIVAVFLDLKRAFEVGDRELLLLKLEHYFGISDRAQAWFDSYRKENRYEQVCLMPLGIKRFLKLAHILCNICRSPIAEAVFAEVVKERGISDQWQVDSAAMGSWHVGKSPDHRARKTLADHKIEYHGKARQIKKDDFTKFDYIFGMDEENISDLNSEKPKGATAKILLLGDFDPQGDRIIRDPYYDSDSKGFEKCYQQCVRSVKGFLDSLR